MIFENVWEHARLWELSHMNVTVDVETNPTLFQLRDYTDNDLSNCVEVVVTNEHNDDEWIISYLDQNGNVVETDESDELEYTDPEPLRATTRDLLETLRKAW